jgi:hypothetical protein
VQTRDPNASAPSSKHCLKHLTASHNQRMTYIVTSSLESYQILCDGTSLHSRLETTGRDASRSRVYTVNMTPTVCRIILWGSNREPQRSGGHAYLTVFSHTETVHRRPPLRPANIYISDLKVQLSTFFIKYRTMMAYNKLEV